MGENVLPASGSEQPTLPSPDTLLDRLLDEQRRRRRCGERDSLRDLLARHPDLASDVPRAAALVYGEFVLREEAGESPALDGYLQRFPALAEELRRLHQADGLFAALLPAPSDLRAGAARFGDYELLNEVGRGGMGVVYKARQVSLNRVVAVKMILSGALATAEEVARFQTEARMAARLCHANIVAVHEVDEHDGRHYFSMDYVEGGSLADAVRGRPLAAQRAARCAEALARAVEYAHGQKVLHRDLKPSNVLLDAAGEPHVTDFGLAKALTDGPGLTATGRTLGTPGYMAPEQADGRSKDVGPAADVYGLGAILYELLTGRPPFQADSPLVTLRQVVTAEPAPPRQLNSAVPRDLETVCLKCLQKEPGQRYASAHDLADDLRRYLGGHPVLARPVGLLRRLARWGRRNPLVASLGGAAAALLLAVAFAASWAALAAQEGRRNRECDALLRQARLEGVPPRRDGWSDRAWEMVVKAVALRRDIDGRTEVAAVLAGLDARKLSGLADREASALAFDATGRVLFCGGMPGEEACLWDTETKEATLSGQQGAGPVGFSADGKPRQFVALDGGRLRLWDVHRGRAIAELDLGDGYVVAHTSLGVPVLAMTPDGDWVAAAATDRDGNGLVAAWNVATGQAWPRVKEKATALALAPGGRHLATGDAEGRVIVRPRLAEGRPVVLPPARGRVECLAFSPDGRRLAVGDGVGTVTLWDWETGHSTPCYGAIFKVTAVAFSQDGTTVASAGTGPAKVWDAATGRLLLDLLDLSGATGLAFAADGRRLAGANRRDPRGGRGHSVALWQLEGGRGIEDLRGLAGPAARVCFSGKGRLLAAYGHGGQVAVWDAIEGRLLRVFEAPPVASADNAGLTFVGEERLAYCGSEQAVVWDLDGGRTVDAWQLGRGSANCLGTDPDGRLLLFRAERLEDDAEPLTCRLRELQPGGKVRGIGETPPFSKLVWDTAAAAEGRVFLASGRDDVAGTRRRTVVALGASDGKILWARPSTREGVDFDNLFTAPGGRLVAVSRDPDEEGPPYRWVLRDAQTGESAGGLMTWVAAVGPGAQRWLCAAAEPHRGLALWERGCDEPVANLAGDGVPSFHPQFSPDGTLVAWGNSNGSVTLCDLPRIQDRLRQIGLGW